MRKLDSYQFVHNSIFDQVKRFILNLDIRKFYIFSNLVSLGDQHSHFSFKYEMIILVVLYPATILCHLENLIKQTITYFD